MTKVPLGPITGKRPAGVDPLPLVATAHTPEETRRWQVLLASKEMWVLRPGETPGRHARLIGVHVEPHDVWLSWIEPATDLGWLQRRLDHRWELNELWLDQHGRMPAHVERHHAWGRMLSNLADRGYAMVDGPGNIRWLNFTARDQHIDWRLKADIIAELVWRESAGVGI